MGGLFLNSSSLIAATSLVEEFDTTTKTWRTMNNMPTSLQGFVTGVNGNSIYAVSGSTTTTMSSGTILNNVHKFNPDIGSNGTWSTLVSANAISGKIDMGGCALNGVIYFNSGRLFSDASVQSTNDGYVISANATTSALSEIAVSSGRHGVASGCYLPKSTDPFPTDLAAVLVVGGSTGVNAFQPVTTISSSTVYDYYLPNSSPVNPNTNTVGPSLPIGLYLSALEFSYQRRRAYLFGGLTGIASASDNFYSLEMSSPVGGAWNLVSSKMPVARYAHKAVVLNR